MLYLDYDSPLHREDVWWHPKRGASIKARPHFTLFQYTIVARRARAVPVTTHRTVDLFAAAPDVLRRHPRDWRSLRDGDQNWPAWCRDELIRTHDRLGISDSPVLAELKAKLAAMMTPKLAFFAASTGDDR